MSWTSKTATIQGNHKTRSCHRAGFPETLVYQLFSNLLRNACHYDREKGGPIEVGSWDEKSSTTYFVRDHGPGVPFQEREKIFDIFYRGKASKGTRGNRCRPGHCA